MYKRANAKFFIEILGAWVETKGDKILSIPSCKGTNFSLCEWNNDSEETKRFKSLKRIISSCIPFFLSFFLFQIYISFLLFSKTRSLLRVIASRVCLFYLLLLFKSWEKVKKNRGWKKNSRALLPWQQNDGVNECQIFWIIAFLAMFWGIKMQALKHRLTFVALINWIYVQCDVWEHFW